MLKLNYMSTLFVGIDVSSKTNAVYAMDFEENKYKIQTANTKALTSNMKTDETPRVESDVTTGASAGAMDKVSSEVSGATGKKRKASMSASLGL